MLLFANDKTMKHLCIHMELSLRSVPPLLSFLMVALVDRHFLPAMTAARLRCSSSNVSSSKTFFFINSVYTNNVLNARVHE